MAAITATHLTGGALIATQNTATTASITPSANKLVLLTVIGVKVPGSVNPPTVTGNGLTWVHVDGQAIVNSRVDTFRAMGASPSAGAITIDYGEAQLRFAWQVDEFTNIDTSGTNGSGAVVQSAKTAIGGVDPATTGMTVTLSAFGDVNNATYGGLGQRNNGATTEGTGFTELGENTDAGGVAGQSEFKNSNDTTVDWSWASVQKDVVGIGIEIKNATQTTVGTTEQGYSYFM